MKISDFDQDLTSKGFMQAREFLKSHGLGQDRGLKNALSKCERYSAIRRDLREVDDCFKK